MGTLSLIIAAIFIGAAVFLLVRTIMGEQLSIEDQERMGIGLAKKEFPSPILKIIYPVVLRILPSVINWKIDKSREKIKKKLSSAGLRDTFTPDEFYAFNVAFALCLPIIIYLYNFIAGLGLSVIYAPVFAAFGWFYPGLWLNGVIKSRQERIRREMPFVVDLLTLCVEAGLDFGGAMAKVVEKGQPGPLRTEFEIILKEIQLGAMRNEAMKNMAGRIGIKEISSFVSILVTAERMGSPVGDVLRAQSDSIRHERYMAAEAKGGKAATKVLIPMVLFILPAVFIAIAGPLILSKIYPGR
ncbi:MAG: type II secretion system F family protein [Proteobacteria bacterium]|nr:type II secretion system F family protein [Pseudomonadota bacterium]